MTFALGIDDLNTEQQHIQNISEFIGRKLVYATLQHSWVDENQTLELYKTQIQGLLNQSLQPVLIWDPVLPRMYSDSLYAISIGLHDNYIESYFNMLKEIQNENQQFIPIIWCGSRLNAPQTFTSNSTLFKQIFTRVKQISLQLNLNARFAVSYDIEYCSCQDQEQQEGCINGMIWDDEQQSYVPCEQQITQTCTVQCQRNITDIYPGDSFVDWIIIQMLNQDSFSTMDVQIQKMDHITGLLQMSKPLMVIISSRSDGGNKSEYISQIPLIQQSQSAKNIKGLLLGMKESNQDTALYDSIKGEIVSSISNNGLELYTYEILSTIFDQFNNLIEETDSQIAASGSLCSPGQYGQLDIMNCKECPVGWYQNQSGQQSCIACEIGYYQDDVGQSSCKQCGEQMTTVAEGTAQFKYCICVENYYKPEENGVCQPCKRNTYSRKAMNTCINCPSDSTWKGSNGKDGQGCFCKLGYQWSSEQAQCIKKQSDSIDNRRIKQKVGICLGLLGIFMFL